jgi:hypothetical protein
MEGSEHAPEGAEGLSEDEIRARVEEQIAKVRVQDLLLESVVGILNLAARRIAKEDEQDLDQARVGIDAVRAVVDLLEPEPAGAVREALAELQMLYARAASGAGPPAGEGGSTPPEEPEGPSSEAPRTGAAPPPGLWTPPGSGS